jgi:hypothetical protein
VTNLVKTSPRVSQATWCGIEAHGSRGAEASRRLARVQARCSSRSAELKWNPSGGEGAGIGRVSVEVLCDRVRAEPVAEQLIICARCTGKGFANRLAPIQVGTSAMPPERGPSPRRLRRLDEFTTTG